MFERIGEKNEEARLFSLETTSAIQLSLTKPTPYGTVVGTYVVHSGLVLVDLFSRISHYMRVIQE
jgi:hypothetical protein